ncbi:MAG: hypothetical protein WCM76_10230 [Bacteroidota bacterium]
MKRFYIAALCILSMISAVSPGCTSGRDNKKINAADPVFEKGAITASVSCEKDRTVTYTLYLPASYDSLKKYPIILAFDSHGTGNIPVELFREQAEKYGYIIAGSNNSRNGQSLEANLGFYDIMLGDLLTRFSVDRTRIYTAGFSGGARVASGAAILRGGISGVIGCSAGFPQTEKPISQKFDFIGFGGTDDMNYAEMVNLDRALEKNAFRHQLITFDGTHAWPPKAMVSEAFVFFELMAMKDGKLAKNDDYIKTALGVAQQKIDSASSAGKKYEEYLLYVKLVRYFDGLADITKQKEALAKLEASAAVKQKQKEIEYSEKKELYLQSEYMKSLQEKDAKWWKAETARLNEFVKKSQNTDEKHLTVRVLEYLSLAAYSTANALLQQNRLDEAERYIELYSIIDPDNSEYAYMFATLYLKKGEKEKSLTSLEKAVELGFNDLSRLQNDTSFTKIRAEEKYLKIVEKLSGSGK